MKRKNQKPEKPDFGDRTGNETTDRLNQEMIARSYEEGPRYHRPENCGVALAPEGLSPEEAQNFVSDAIERADTFCSRRIFQSSEEEERVWNDIADRGFTGTPPPGN